MQVIGNGQTIRPDTDISVMTRTRFDKFLHIHSGANQITAFVDIDTYENGDIGVKLLTKNRFKKSSIIRIKEHAAVYYPRDQSGLQTSRPIRFPVCFQPSRGLVSRFLRIEFTVSWFPLDRLFTVFRANFFISEYGVIARIVLPQCASARVFQKSWVRLFLWMRPIMAPACGDSDTHGWLRFPWGSKNERYGITPGQGKPISAGFFP